MNKNIQQLCNIATKQKKFIVGLMSGTSLDGLDIALCSVEGSGLQTKIQVKHFETVDYTDHFKKELKSILFKKNIDLEKLTLVSHWIGLQHADYILRCLKKWNVNKKDVDLIASHGQTIYHAPVSLHKNLNYGNATLQIGDGDHLAVATGIITISDFRQKHIAAGGEGAPLAAYGDYILFSKRNQDRILLNIGGIANFTFLPGSLKTDEIMCTDIGPGNTLLDAYVQENFSGKYYDENATVAFKGNINEQLLKELKNHTFFTINLPKTTGPELFNLEYLKSAKERSYTLSLSIEDTMATLTKFTADTIVSALDTYRNAEVFVSGGGVHNKLLMNYLDESITSHAVKTIDALGISSDAKEAVLFAILANECVSGETAVFNNAGRTLLPVSMGKISFPY